MIVLAAAPALAEPEPEERGEVRADLQVYAQPAVGDALVVLTPSVYGRVRATKWLAFDVDWLADVVTGATPRSYGPPDVVTAATPFSEVRNVIGADAQATWRMLTFTAGYTFGIESDYRSHVLKLGLKADLLQHNTILSLDYDHSFDSICDLSQPGTPVTLRQPLDRPTGCFSGKPQLTDHALDIDTLEASWVQALAKHWIATMVLSYQHLSGFQSNPYRSVFLSAEQFLAQESHPDVRDRGSLTGRSRYAIAKVHGTLGMDLRVYRDSWDIWSLTGEITYEQPFRQSHPAWRFRVRARSYGQTGAFFFRDTTAADSYERAGPVGRFFTGDQALAPIADLLLGGRASWTGHKAKRHWRAFTDMEASLVLEWMRIFALTPNPPNVARTQGWASSILLGLSASGRF